MVMNLIKTIMYVLWADYESNKLDYVIHILIMDIMVIIDDYGILLCFCISLFLFMVTNFIDYVMYELCTGYENQ